MEKDDAIITGLILAVIAVAEGVRRLPGGGIVLRRSLAGTWVVGQLPVIGGAYRLVSWCIPLSLPMVLSSAPLPAESQLGLRRLRARLKARYRRTRDDIAALQWGGFVVLLALAVGVPWSVWTRGAQGLILSLGLVIALCAFQANVAASALMRAGVRRRDALSIGIGFLWPFAATRAAEAVVHRVVDGVPRMAVLHELLGEDVFLRENRRLIYDVVASRERHSDADAINQLYPASRLAALLERSPDGAADEAYCPRCATVFRDAVQECSECHLVLRRRNLKEASAS